MQGIEVMALRIRGFGNGIALFALMGIVMALSACDVSPAPHTSAQESGMNAQEASSGEKVPAEPSGYQELARKDQLVLLADMGTGDFVLQNTASGKQWYSTPPNADSDPYSIANSKMEIRSQLVITYVFREEENSNARLYTANSYACVQEGSIRVEPVDSGLRVTYFFETLDITIPVEFTLQEGYLNAAIDIQGIRQGEVCKLVKLNLLPGLGAGSWEESGYLFVPDGCGALIHFNNGSSEIYEQAVYGDELAIEKELDSEVKEQIHMPVFGVVSGGDALMGVIAEGDGASSIRAYSGNASRGYNSVSSSAVLQYVSQKTMFGKSNNKQTVYRLSPGEGGLQDYQVRYYPLHGEEASYAGMANRYREYLVREKGLQKAAQMPSLHVNVIGAIPVKANFIGFTYQKETALTTYEQAQTMMRALQEQGVGHISLRFQGWGNEGLSNRKVPLKAEPMGILGGEKQFDALFAYAQENGCTVYPDVDLLTYRSGHKNEAAKTAFNEIAWQYAYMSSVYAQRLDTPAWMLLSPTKYMDYGTRYLDSYKKLGPDTISLSTLTSSLYSDLKQKDGVYRSEVPAIVSGLLESYREAGLAIAGEAANAYAVPYLTQILDAPSRCSGFRMEDEEVPFYQLVLHGYLELTSPSLSQSADPDTEYLKALETGSSMLWTGIGVDASIVTNTAYDRFYSSDYERWLDDASAKYAESQSYLERVYDQAIVSHRALQSDVMETVFENGITVVVNYNETAVTVDGTEVAGKGFVIRDSGGD